MPALTQIMTSSLRHEAYRAIRAGIVSGEIVAGEIHSAPSLARQLGVSATPVREAMLDLAGEGLVEPVRNRGFRILAVDDHALDEILELRMLLEVPSVAQVAGRLTADEVARLRGHADAIERAAQARDMTAFLTADHVFHLSLIEPLGNARLVELVGRLRDQQRLYGLPRVVQSPLFIRTAGEHREILDAVVAGESAQAKRLVCRHLRQTRGIWARSDGPRGPGQV